MVLSRLQGYLAQIDNLQSRINLIAGMAVIISTGSAGFWRQALNAASSLYYPGDGCVAAREAQPLDSEENVARIPGLRIGPGML